MSKTLREKEIPPELQKQIDSNTVFMYAKISRNKIDYISNILYKLDNNLVFTRKTNEQQPPDNRLFFCNDNDVFFMNVEKNKYKAFYEYLNNINLNSLDTYYKTPDNISVNGGSIIYIFIANRQGKKWIYFEPESSVLPDKILENFDKIF